MGQQDQQGAMYARGRFFGAMCILVFATVLARLTRLGHELWSDETYNWFVSNGGVGRAASLIQEDYFPPLYSVLLAGWLDVFPDSSFSLRFLSTMAGVAMVGVVVLFLNRAIGKRAAFWGALFVALSPIQGMWAQIARPFALEIAFTVLALYQGYRIIGIAALPRLDAKPFLWLFFALVGAIYTSHGAVVFTFVSFFVVLGVRLAAGAAVFDRVNQYLMLTYGLVLVAWLPLLPQVLDQMARSQDLVIAIHRPSLAALLNSVSHSASIAFLWGLQPLAQLFMAFLIIMGLRYIAKVARPLLRYFLGLCVGYIGFLLLMYLVADPVFGRVLQNAWWLNIVLMMIAGVGAMSLWPKDIIGRHTGEWWLVLRNFAAGAVVVAVLLLHGRALYNFHISAKPRWTTAAAQLEGRVQAGDFAVADPALSFSSVLYFMPEKFSKDTVVIERRPQVMRHGDLATFITELRARFSGKTTRIWLFLGGTVPPTAKLAIDAEAAEVLEIEKDQLTILLLEIDRGHTGHV